MYQSIIFEGLGASELRGSRQDDALPGLRDTPSCHANQVSIICVEYICFCIFLFECLSYILICFVFELYLNVCACDVYFFLYSHHDLVRI